MVVHCALMLRKLGSPPQGREGAIFGATPAMAACAAAALLAARKLNAWPGIGLINIEVI